jgi:purine nucleoside permease
MKLLLLALLTGALSPGLSHAALAAEPLEIRAVVVTAFEIGAETGDTAGELQRWAEVMPQTLPFPAGERALRYDPEKRVLVLNTGIGTNRAAVTVMALGTDPRFDLTRAYWLIAAIAGVNPNVGAVGSAAWIGDLVDTDHGYVIDAREVPAGWSTGILPHDRSQPYQEPRGEPKYNLFPLNKGLRDWAYALTAKVPLPDTPSLARQRAGYPHYPAARCLPSVMTGDEATGQGFWHGERLNAHVEKWVAYWTGRPGTFTMTGMEDTGVANALTALQKLGKADAARLMVLRTASNYTIQPEGKDAAQSLSAESTELSALQPSVDAAFLLGSRVVAELTGDWPKYRDAVPSGPPAPAVTPARC